MTRICVDNTVSEISQEPQQNLGDVLDNIISTLPQDRIVTGITLDGRHISRAERQSFSCQPIKDFLEVSIRTSDKAIWTANGIDIALSSLERIQQSLLTVAELFRDNKIVEANHFFSHCIEGLERFSETMLITRCALRIDYSQIRMDGLTLSRIEEDLSSILEAILECQERGDYEGIAERVEYELITNICAWQNGLKKIKMSRTSNA